MIDELEALEFEPLPEVVPLEWVTERRRARSTPFELIASYNRAIELCYRA